MTGSYANVFGGTAIRPSQPSYLALSLSTNTTLVWPLETTGGAPYVAAQIDVTATQNGLSLAMPPGNTGSDGAQAIVTNVGADSFTLTDNGGNQIVVIAAGVSWLVTLIDNTTTNGTWRGYQLGATVSNANAGALAGLGLQANGSLLQVQLPPFSFSANTALTPAHRSGFITWTGGVGTLQLNASGTLTSGWFCLVANDGTGLLTISCTGGDLINGNATLPLEPGNSAIVECSGAGFATVGNTQSPLSVLNGGTGANNSGGALTNLGGTAIGQSIFTAPNAAAVVALLGLSAGVFTETTVSTNQNILAPVSQTAFVATAPITATLALTTVTFTTGFICAFFAIGGAITLTPQVSDAINNGAAGASYVIPQGGSGVLMTDTNGNWYVFLESIGNVAKAKTALGLGTAAFANTGTSGNTVPLLNGSNIWSGATLSTSSFAIGPSGVDLAFTLSADSGHYKQIAFDQNNGTPTPSPRWRLGGDNTPTSGSNTDTNFLFQAVYDDATLHTVYTVNRASQVVSFVQSPIVPTPGAGDASNKASTTAFAQGVGFGQTGTLHSVPGNALNTVYTNSGTQLKYVAVSITATVTGVLTMTIGTYTISMTVTNGSEGWVGGFVPPGVTYEVVAGTGTQGTILYWLETY